MSIKFSRKNWMIIGALLVVAGTVAVGLTTQATGRHAASSHSQNLTTREAATTDAKAASGKGQPSPEVLSANTASSQQSPTPSGSPRAPVSIRSIVPSKTPAPSVTPGYQPVRTDGKTVLPITFGKTEMTIYPGSEDLSSAELNPRGNPDGTVSDSQMLCDPSGETANGQIYASTRIANCSNSLSFAVYVHLGTPPGSYTLRAQVTSRSGVIYYGYIKVNVPPPPTPLPSQP
jgi:hypothetical protein